MGTSTTVSSALLTRFQAVRSLTDSLSEPLCAEDQVVQSMPDASPTKWHRAHTTWFFETFVLPRRSGGHAPFHPAYGYLFNSYYEAVGARHARNERGLLSRPTVDEVAAYRRHIDTAVGDLLTGEPLDDATATLIELGINHEQQHQELLLMDIKHLLAQNPLRPEYAEPWQQPSSTEPPPLQWHEHDGGIVPVGHQGEGFAFDNESPRHDVLLAPFRLADRLTTCGEWIEFIDDGGYERAELWLSDGWARRCDEQWDAPLYWHREDEHWRVFTLRGDRPVNPAEPVCHVSFFEADAYARWAGARLPHEAEWETVAVEQLDAGPLEGHFLDDGPYHPTAASSTWRHHPVRQLFGDVWEFTSSPYIGYPGFSPAAGAVGEYNGKFMSGQMVLRGGCCVTPWNHIRPTYRNFFPPHSRWQFGGVRLASDDD
jgi:ergothioneine biosynthesis protein EgtB